MRARTATGEPHFWSVSRPMTFFLCTLLAVAARGQEADVSTPPLDRLRLPSDDSGLLTTEGATVLPHLGSSFAFALDYGHNPVVLRDAATGDVAGALVQHRVGGAVAGTVGLFGRMSLGLELPLVLFQNAGELAAFQAAPLVAPGLAPVGVGDLRIVPKVQVLRQRKHLLNLAFVPVVTLPTAAGLALSPSPTFRYGGDFLGEGPASFTLQPGVALSFDVAAIRGVGMVSYRLKPPTPLSTPAGTIALDSEFALRAGLGAWLDELFGTRERAPDAGRTLPPALAFLEVMSAVSDSVFFSQRSDDALTNAQRATAQLSAEWHAGLRIIPLNFPWQFTAAVGGGFLRGVGTPDLRVVTQLRWQPPPRKGSP